MAPLGVVGARHTCPPFPSAFHLPFSAFAFCFGLDKSHFAAIIPLMCILNMPPASQGLAASPNPRAARAFAAVLCHRSRPLLSPHSSSLSSLPSSTGQHDGQVWLSLAKSGQIGPKCPQKYFYSGKDSPRSANTLRPAHGLCHSYCYREKFRFFGNILRPNSAAKRGCVWPVSVVFSRPVGTRADGTRVPGVVTPGYFRAVPAGTASCGRVRSIRCANRLFCRGRVEKAEKCGERQFAATNTCFGLSLAGQEELWATPFNPLWKLFVLRGKRRGSRKVRRTPVRRYEHLFWAVPVGTGSSGPLGNREICERQCGRIFAPAMAEKNLRKKNAKSVAKAAG